MFTTMNRELRELISLTAWIAQYDATRAARPEIVPTEESLDGRRRKELRKVQLMEKYELIGTRR